MKTLFLLRHSLTAANEARLYCGRVDLPLSPAGRALAGRIAVERPLPACDAYVHSGMRRASQTLALLTGRAEGIRIRELREMDFGAFEMRSYAQMKDDTDFIAWIEDPTGEVPCPGGESRNAFRERVLRGGKKLLDLPAERVTTVCHGGTIVTLMEHWFPQTHRLYYEWQPDACRGYAIQFSEAKPQGFDAI